MSIPVTGTASISNRLGIIGGNINFLNDSRGDDFETRVLDTNNQYLATDQDLVQGLYTQRDIFRTTGDPLATYWQALAQATMIQMANDSAPINPLDLPTAINALTTQLNATGSGYVRPTVSATVTPYASNVGDAVLAASIKGGNGRQLDYVFAENVVCTVTADSGTGSTALQEPVQYVGQIAVPYIQWNWPQGSGTQLAATITNATNSTQISNGSFETWANPTTTPPSNWTLQDGVINVDLVQQTSPVLTGTYSAGYVGDGATNTTLQQPVNLLPLRVYAFCCWLRMSATPGAGVFRAALLDDPAGAVVNDAQGVANSVSQTLSAAPTSSWLALTTFFRTPATLPDTTYLSLGFTTALSASRTMYLDRVALVAATQLYNGGIFAAVFSGGTPSQAGDYWTIAVATDADNETFPRLQDRVFQLRDKGLYIPTVVSGGIPNNLIT